MNLLERQRQAKLAEIKDRKAEYSSYMSIAQKFGALTMTAVGSVTETLTSAITGTRKEEMSPSRLRNNAYGIRREQFVARKFWALVGTTAVVAALYGGEQVANYIEDRTVACSGETTAVIQKGETLYDIAATVPHRNTSLDAIAETIADRNPEATKEILGGNGQNADEVEAMSRLIVPANCDSLLQ